MAPSTVQTILWWLFFAAYFASKYFVGGFTGFSLQYLISVVALTLLTALLPWYGMKWLTAKLDGAAQIAATLVLPVLLTALGLSIFFIVFIQPNYETIKLAAIIHRALLPGFAITVLLYIPAIMSRLSGKNKPEAS